MSIKNQNEKNVCIQKLDYQGYLSESDLEALDAEHQEEVVDLTNLSTAELLEVAFGWSN
jgi:hypothetical protein